MKLKFENMVKLIILTRFFIYSAEKRYLVIIIIRIYFL